MMLHPSPEMILFYLSLSKGSLAVVILQFFLTLFERGAGVKPMLKKMSYFVKAFWHKMHVILA